MNNKKCFIFKQLLDLTGILYFRINLLGKRIKSDTQSAVNNKLGERRPITILHG